MSPRAKCPDCGKAFSTTDAYPFCPECGSQNAHVVSASVGPSEDGGGIDWSDIISYPVPMSTATAKMSEPRCGREMSNGEKCVLPAGHSGPHRDEVDGDE